MPRSLNEINADYQQICLKLGDLAVQREKVEKGIKSLMSKVDVLNDEANARMEIDNELKKSTEVGPGPKPKNVIDSEGDKNINIIDNSKAV